MEEIWKDIPGYEGLYQVSNLGRVKSLIYKQKNKILKTRLHKSGYIYIDITFKNKKTYKVHRLVALTFIPNLEDKRCVNHINGIKIDNRLENLEWVTHQENSLHSINILGKKVDFNKGLVYGKHYNSKKVNQYTKDGDFIKTWDCIKRASDILKIDNSDICKACKGKLISAGGYIWKYN